MGLQDRLEQAVLHSVSNLLESMIPMPFKRGEEGKSSDGHAHLLGTIDVKGRLNGSICVSMPVPLAVNMASLMLDEELEEISDDVYETIAEMTNIIAGGIKTFLSQQDDIFQLGLPQVLELARFDARSDGQRLAVPIETDKGCFVVLTSLYELPADADA